MRVLKRISTLKNQPDKHIPLMNPPVAQPERVEQSTCEWSATEIEDEVCFFGRNGAMIGLSIIRNYMILFYTTK